MKFGELAGRILPILLVAAIVGLTILQVVQVGALIDAFENRGWDNGVLEADVLIPFIVIQLIWHVGFWLFLHRFGGGGCVTYSIVLLQTIAQVIVWYRPIQLLARTLFEAAKAFFA